MVVFGFYPGTTLLERVINKTRTGVKACSVSVCLSVCMPVIRPSLCPPLSQSIRLSVYVYVCLHVRLFLIDYPPVCLFCLMDVIVSACLAARSFNSIHQYIPCSSSPTTLDIMLVKIGLTVDLKRPSSGAARKREKCNHQLCCLSYVKSAFFCIAMSIVNLSVIRVFSN